MASCWSLYCVCLFLITYRAAGFSVRSVLTQRPVVVVGKIIIDEYGEPSAAAKTTTDSSVVVGGGGPQAAFGAAAALAILFNDKEDPLLPQPVTLIGPVGNDDWTEREESALYSSLGGAVTNIHLLSEESLKTPRIQIWHDETQNVQWKPLNDSFGPLGAQGLWRVPRPEQFLEALPSTEEGVVCHVIIEGGENSPGNGEDSTFLLDPIVQQRIEYLGIEPVVFCSDETGRVAASDVASCTRRLDRIASVDLVSPDNLLYQEMDSESLRRGIEIGVRDGPRGSLVIDSEGTKLRVPAATLATEDGEPVNPTGAGNSYAASFTACRGSGASVVESACIASAVGAVFCEYEHMPPWNASVLRRIRQAASEVSDKVHVVKEVIG
jgi:hypothetical protein